MFFSDKYIDTLSLMESLKDYSSPRSKLTTMIKEGEIRRIKRGLYLSKNNQDYSVKTLANKIYGPSYISFEYALSYYGLIPERVANLTSAIFNKNKSKRFETEFGNFFYLSIPQNAYPYEIIHITEGDDPFLIASKEKALCDYLYKNRNITTIKLMNELMTYSLRIDLDELSSCDIDTIKKLSAKYNIRVIDIFVKWFTKEFMSA